MKRKGKYITTNILLACFAKSPVEKKDIHTQLEETITQRKKLIEQWEILLPGKIFRCKARHSCSIKRNYCQA